MRFHGIRRAVRIPRGSRREIEREIDDELAFHIATRADALRAAGMPDREALAEASRRFGEVTRVREECIGLETTEHRRETLMTFLDNLVADLRLATRSLRRTPGFTVVALTTLVLGIASVTSIFSYFNAIYFSALPWGDPSRLVALSETRGRNSVLDYSYISADAVRLVRQSSRSFERVTVYLTGGATILAGGEPQSIQTLKVDSSFVPTFALHPQLGRLVTAGEITANAHVAMISDVLWRAHYGQDPAVVGRTIELDEGRYEIVGVLPAGFRFPYQTDVLLPLRDAPDSGETTTNTFVSAVATLRPGITRQAARAEVTVLAARLRGIDARAYRQVSLFVRDEMLDRRGRQFLPLPGVFLGAGFFLLLIACTNVTNLFYVRAAQRRGEMAIRASLGAGRARLIRHALTESLLISAVAAALGTLLAQWLVKLWLHAVPTQGFPSWFHVALDMRILAFAIGVTALVTVVVGLAPAREGTRFDLVRALKRTNDFGSSSNDVTRGSKRGLVLQLALSMSLFISAALLVRSFQRLTTIDVGYPADRIAMVHPILNRPRYPDPAGSMRFALEHADQAAALPGVSATAVRGYFGKLRDASNVVTEQPDPSTSRFDPRLIPDGDTTRAVRVVQSTDLVVSDGYFALLGLRLRSGRTFAPSDGNGAPLAVVIGARTAQLLWGTVSPVGRTIQPGRSSPPLTVIGVVDDVHDLRGGSRGFSTDALPTIYRSAQQAVSYAPEILARGPGDVAETRKRILGLVRASDPMLIVYRDVTLASQLDQAFLVTRVFGGVIAALAAAALALSIVGIYGVVAFGIAQRTRELGIRIALGGTVDDVMKLILRQTMAFVGIGLALGLLLAVAIGRLLKIFLYGVSPLDPLTYLVVAALFGAVALLASWWPARRVTRIDPLIAIRAD